MLKLCSKGTEHVLRALMEIGGKEGAQRIHAKEICERGGLPEAYTRKVLHGLVKDGYLEASLGPGGGYSLTRPAEEISLLEIIQSVEGAGLRERCALGIVGCDHDNPCPLHSDWVRLCDGLFKTLEETTLAQLVDLSFRAEDVKAAQYGEGLRERGGGI